MKQISKVFLACACSLSGLTTQAQDQTVWSNDFSNASQPLNTVGRGVCRVNDGVFHSRSAYALFGNPEWKDYTLSFKARAPKDAEQVQIWAGFRTHNRFDRYVVGIKGGLQDDQRPVSGRCAGGYQQGHRRPSRRGDLCGSRG